MDNHQLYKVYSNLDHPKRIIGFTINEVVVAFIGVLFTALSEQKVLVILFSLVVLATLRRLKKNKGPKCLLVLAYWCLPRFVTKLILPNLPDSSKRLWKA